MFFSKKEEGCEKLKNIINGEFRKIFNDKNLSIEEKLKKLLETEKREILEWEYFKANFPVGFFAIDPNRVIVEHNKVFEELTGFSAYEIDGNAGGKILWPINPADCQVCKLAVKYISERRSGEGFANIITKRGEKVPVFVYVVPIIIDGQVTKTFILIRDKRPEIKERKEFMEKQIAPIKEILLKISSGDVYIIFRKI
jgi:PAS domain S-box-containing protein